MFWAGWSPWSSTRISTTASDSTSSAGLLRVWELRVEVRVLNGRGDEDSAGGDVLLLLDLDDVCEDQEKAAAEGWL